MMEMISLGRFPSVSRSAWRTLRWELLGIRWVRQQVVLRVKSLCMLTVQGTKNREIPLVLYLVEHVWMLHHQRVSVSDLSFYMLPSFDIIYISLVRISSFTCSVILMDVFTRACSSGIFPFRLRARIYDIIFCFECMILFTCK